ncbi:hypothetical protein PR003_g30871, partial [Phytophthora rubi]
MREGMTRYCLTRAEPSTLEAAFALALREGYTVASSYARALTPDARASAPEPMEIDAIEAESRSRSTSTARGPRFGNDNLPRDGRPLVCYRCRKTGHRAAVCRAPAPVLASAEVVGEADDTFPTALPKKRSGPVAPVLYAHFNATTTNGDSRLILISLHVAGAERPLRALLDSGATNNFIRDDCLALLPPHVRVREGPGEIVVKLADGKPHRAPRRAVSLAYAFDGFSTNDDFLAIELNYAFDCILGMPWLARYQPEIDCQQPPSRAREGLKRNTVEQWLPYENYAVEQGLPHVKNAVEQRLPPVLNAVEMRFPHVKNAVEQRLPLENATVEQRLPFADDSVAQQDLRDTGMVESELPCLEEGEVPSSESSSSVTSTSSSGSRRLRKSKRNRSGRRRLRRRSTAVDQAPSSEILNVVEYSEGSPNQVRAIEVANPPTDAATITRLPGLPWKHFLRDLKAVSDDTSSSRPKAAEPKSVREARFAAQSWQALQDSNNPVYSLAREFEDIFPEKIPAELSAERGVRHEIDLVPGSKYCVTPQWPLPRDQVHAIDDFFEGRRKAGHVRESISPHSSPTFCVKKATGGWRIVHAFNKLNDATIPAQTPI